MHFDLVNVISYSGTSRNKVTTIERYNLCEKRSVLIGMRKMTPLAIASPVRSVIEAF